MAFSLKIITIWCGPDEWTAYRNGEDIRHRGCGPTEAEAIADLQRLDQERAEANEPDEESPR